MKIIKTILESEIFAAQPPVLFDIGASGEINSRWKTISSFSVCIAFDADEREFTVSEKNSSGYKKLICINRAVTAGESGQTDFYLTKSPFCSSTLEPDAQKLQPWAFHDLFSVNSKSKLPSISVQQALKQADLNYIDWFKSDSQGTDLRLFKSIPPQIINTVLAAEFEPGIIDAYKNEDKLFTVMHEMHQAEYWLSSINLKGAQRFNTGYFNSNSFTGKRLIKKSPAWAELVYLQNKMPANKRQLLLLYVFALIEKQYGFALELADEGIKIFNDPIFHDCKKACFKKLKIEKLKIPLVILKKQLNKLLQNIND
jgi:hypothetical protein